MKRAEKQNNPKRSIYCNVNSTLNGINKSFYKHLFINKKWSILVLCRHKIQPTRPARCNGGWGWMMQGRQGTLCCQCDLMMMIYRKREV